MNTIPNPHPDALRWLWGLVYDMRLGSSAEDARRSTNWLARYGYIQPSGQGGWLATSLAEPLLLRFSDKLAARGMNCPPSEDERATALRASMPDVGRWSRKP